MAVIDESLHTGEKKARNGPVVERRVRRLFASQQEAENDADRRRNGHAGQRVGFHLRSYAVRGVSGGIAGWEAYLRAAPRT